MAHTNNILVKSTSLAFLSSFFDRIYIESQETDIRQDRFR